MRKLTTSEFVSKARGIHGKKYDYTKVNYINATEKVIIVCPFHGQFNQNLIMHVHRKAGCPTCSLNRVHKNNKMTINNFLQTARKIHGEYTYPNLKLKDGLRTKIDIKCEIHGVFIMEARAHLHNKYKCPVCRRIKQRLSTEQFISNSQGLFGDFYDYSNTSYIKNNIRVKINCPDHGNIEISPKDHYRVGCFKCKKNRSEDLWMDEVGIPNDGSCRQKQIIIDDKKLIVDGICADTNTVYLFHGDYWHGNPTIYNPDDINYNIGKTFGELYNDTIKYENILQNAGYKVIVMWEQDWIKQRGKSK